MTIGIDCRLSEESGVGRYIRNLVSHLAVIDTENSYVLFVNNNRWIGELPKKSRLVPVTIPWHSVKEQLLFPRVIAKEQVDLMHFPYFVVPITYSKPFVVTIHDLIINHFATGRASTKMLPLYWLKRFGYQLTLNHAITKASAIITPSFTTRDELVSHYQVNPELVHVMYEGGLDKKIAPSKPTFISEKSIDRFFLYVGNAYPHKNLDRLIDAFKLFKQQKQSDIKLVLVGKEDFFYRRLRDRLTHHVFKKDIVMTGFITESELIWLYQQAISLVFPSLMEGFGLPAVEAMQAGCVVAASECSALKEICGNVGIYFDPTNTASIVSVLQKISDLSFDQRRTELISFGKKRGMQFSWDSMASHTHKLYEHCNRL